MNFGLSATSKIYNLILQLWWIFEKLPDFKVNFQWLFKKLSMRVSNSKTQKIGWALNFLVVNALYLFSVARELQVSWTAWRRLSFCTSTIFLDSNKEILTNSHRFWGYAHERVFSWKKSPNLQKNPCKCFAMFSNVWRR